MRRLMRAALLFLLLCLPSAASGQTATSEKEVCRLAAEDGQQLRDDGRYKEARQKFLVCAREVCPGAIRDDCSAWLVSLQSTEPTVVFAARDAAGKDLSDVRVYVDGARIAERLDGKPVLLDPGEHRIRYEAQGLSPVEERLVVHAGEKSRLVRAQFPPSSKPPSPSEKKPIPPLVWILGGVSVVGLSAGTYLGVRTLSERSDYDRCKPLCDAGDVDASKSRAIVTDALLGIGLLSLGGATLLFLNR